MVRKTVPNIQLPNFIEKYLSIDEDGSICTSQGVEYLFYPNKQWIYVWDGNYMKLFRSIYSLLKNRFGFEFSFVVNDNAKLELNSESAFLKNELNELQFFSFSLVMHCPIYWFNNGTKEFGQSLLKNGFKVNFNIVDTAGGGSPFSFSFYYYHYLFSNNIVKWGTFGTDKPELYYFEPASTVNRLKTRNIALEIQALFPDMIIEFSGRKSRIRPYDNYGFLDGAEYVVEPKG